MSARTRFNVIGKPRRRVDGRAKVTGQTRFADDIKLPRMLHCKILRSPLPHARIESIDVARAEAHPGVHLVLTGKDFPVTYGMMPVSQDEYPLAPERVRYVGDPVAAVIARDEQTAAQALDLIDVRYQPLKTIATIEEALATPEPRIHDYGERGNIHRNQSYEFGDVEEALAHADHVFEDVFFFEGNTHLPIEQHAAVATVDADGKLTLWSSTQVPHYLHRALSRALQFPAAHIRVIACPNGGGFGGKCDLHNHEIVVSRAALRLGRPVKICLSREEVFYMHRGRHPVLMKMRTGVTRDGRLTGMSVQTLLDGGGYGGYGAASTFYTGVLQPVTYELPRYRFDAARVFTNKPACGPKRGHGTPQPRFGQEVQLDKIAERLGMDPAELRLNIVAKPNSLTANWLRIGSIGLAECIHKVVDASGWKDKHRKLPEGRGIGIACAAYLSGAGVSIYWNKMPHSGVQLLLDRSGQVTVFCGATEIGQGSDDVLAAIVAEVLGIDAFDVRCVTGDTGITPVDLGSYSSRVTVMMGNAAIQAAERVRELIADAAADELDVLPERVVFARGQVFASEDPSKTMSFREAVAFAETKYGTLGSVGSYSPPKAPGRYKGAGVGPSPAYSYTACVVEVDVDPITGWITVPKVWVAHDIGRTINPVLARGQVEGSIYMGLGEALMEEQVFRRLPPKLSNALVHKIPSLLEYKSLTSLDMPEVETILVEDPDPNCPFGAKEVGQGPLLPVMPAVANAVFDAVGVRIDEVPITPDKILAALAKKAKGEVARVGPDRFPDVPYPEPIFVLPPSEGGDGNATKAPHRDEPARHKEAAAS
ncbi:MAG: xanthine dehydrogenase family protein molybdopterin-binding subunit [Betaproteobacteria bacterium]|jgi:4-hydroxybenzoyl-CoA reductase alpha subunit|nr:xanthine dehydrogenase family protein molybdopterin-binding subunit [Betaproteobacteria bacterium]